MKFNGKDTDHGVAEVKDGRFEFLEKGTRGTITAYLPDMQKFAIWFGDNGWFTFDYTEEEFLDAFNVYQKIEDDNQPDSSND